MTRLVAYSMTHGQAGGERQVAQTEARPEGRALVDGQLMAEGEDIDLVIEGGAERRSQEPEQEGQ